MAVCMAVVALFCMSSVAAANARERPVVLLFHAGGFVFEDPGHMAMTSELARGVEFDVSYVSYPLLDLQGAIAAAERRARRLRADGREVFAYGESVGGTLAALLAQRGLVDAAATYSPVADMRSFVDQLDDPEGYVELIGADRRSLREASPVLHSSPRPILAMFGAAEDEFMVSAIRRWEHRDRSVEVKRVPGLHTGSYEPVVHANNAVFALRWLMRHYTF